jgi:AcrR family transcriptional regulator
MRPVSRRARAPAETAPETAPRRAPRQARSRERVERVLAAAARIVETRGLEAVTTNAIAEEAGLPVGTIYQFFPNREAVLLALLARGLDALDARFAPLLGPEHDAEPLEQTVDAVVAALAAAYTDVPALAVLIQGLRLDPRFAEVADANNERIAGWLVELMLRQAPELPAERRRAIATTAVVASDAVLMAWLRAVRAGAKARARALLDELRALLVAYLGGILPPAR